MKQGTTPEHIFTLPFDTALVQTVQITYAQNGDIILQKKTDDCVMEGARVTCYLTQKETFLFGASGLVSIQMRVLTTEGNALASDIVRVGVGACLDRGVLT